MFSKLGTNDEHALEDILRVYGDDLRHRINRILQNPSLTEEVLSETLMTLWENRQKVAEMKNPEAWLYTIARNKAIDKIRAEKKFTNTSTLNLNADRIPNEANSDELLQLKELTSFLQEALEKLPQQEKAVYELTEIHGWTRKQIAEKFKLSESTIKNHLTLARKAIRKFLFGKMKSIII